MLPNTMKSRTTARPRPAAWIYLACVASTTLALLSARPANAQGSGIECTTASCQGPHEAPTQQYDIRNGDCKTGNETGSEPQNWQSSQSCSGEASWYYKTWVRTLSNIQHNADCVDSSECWPCGGVGIYGPCTAPAITSVTWHRHYWVNPLTGAFYNHDWTSNIASGCNCGRHGCDK